MVLLTKGVTIEWRRGFQGFTRVTRHLPEQPFCILAPGTCRWRRSEGTSRPWSCHSSPCTRSAPEELWETKQSD